MQTSTLNRQLRPLWYAWQTYVQYFRTDGSESTGCNPTLRIQKQKDASVACKENNEGCATWIGLSALEMQYYPY